MSARQRDIVLGILLVLALQNCYSGIEIHRHVHEAVNACSGEQIYDRLGREIR